VRRRVGPAVHTLPLFAVLVIAAILRLWNLQARGLIYWDEAKFALEGVRMRAVILHAAGGNASLLAGKSVGTAKPTHALLFGLAYLVLGVHDWVPLIVDGLASLSVVALTFLVARRLFSIQTALFASALMAVSEYEVIYARSALSESDGCMFLLLGVLVWLPRASQQSLAAPVSRVVVSATILGAGFTVNYRLLPYISAFALLDVFPLLKARDFRAAVFHVAAWTAGILAVPIAWQIVGVAAQAHGAVLFQNELTGKKSSYLAEAVYQLHQGKQSSFNFSPLPYLEWFAVREGPFVVLLVVAGFWAAARKRTAAWAVAWAPVVLPYVVYVFAPFIVPRNLEAALPFVSIVAAAGLMELIQSLRSVGLRKLVAAALVTASIVTGCFMSWRLTAERSGFVAAARYVELQSQSRVLTSTEDITFYFRGSGPTCDSPALPRRLSVLRASVKSGYRYAVIDRHGTAVSAFIRARAHLAKTFVVTGPLDLWENVVHSENTHPPGFTTRQDRVWIYDLRTLRFPASVSVSRPVPSCNRDIVS
jgi:4-amino-4-deoxy-L-arabinose transferase-like glycosyltransferase